MLPREVLLLLLVVLEVGILFLLLCLVSMLWVGIGVGKAADLHRGLGVVFPRRRGGNSSRSRRPHILR